MQCLLVFPILLCVFGGATYLVLCGIDNAIFVFAIVIFLHTTLPPPYVVVMLTASSM